MSMRGFTVETPGALLTGEMREGDGRPPLVLIHGFGGSRRDWDKVIAALPEDLPLVAYDLRGFGDSSAEEGVIFSHSEDLVAVLGALRLEEADLCGLSQGGAIVLDGALRAPGRVGRLALVSPMLAGWSWSSEWVERWKQIGRLARAGDLEAARTLWWNHPLFATTREGPAAEDLRRAIWAFSGRQWVKDEQRDEWPMLDRLPMVTHPTLLLTGAHDLADFRLKADLIAGSIAQIARIDYPDAGHMLALEKPREIASAIASFLTRL